MARPFAARALARCASAMTWPVTVTTTSTSGASTATTNALMMMMVSFNRGSTSGIRGVSTRSRRRLEDVYAARMTSRCTKRDDGVRAMGFASSAATLPEHAVLPMPALSPTMERGGLAKWHKAVGDAVRAGDVIADVETDKATMAMEATDDGFMAAILVPEGSEDVEVGTPVCVTVENEEDVGAFKDYEATPVEASSGAGAAAVETPVSSAPAAAAAAAAPVAATTTRAPAMDAGDRVFASPLARRLAQERGITLAHVRGTGPNGRIIADDVLAARADAGAGVVAAQTVVAEHPLSKFFPDFEDVSVSAIKRVTAQRLTESKQQVPHFYLTVDVRLDNMMDIRQTLNKQLAEDKTAEGAKISVNDFIIKASSKALLDVPDVNASWLGDKIRKYKKADISVAVQTDRGLMVPIVRSACCLGLKSISSEVKALAGRARAGTLTPQDMTGGTFTISNLGMFGVKSFAAIVNPPQAAILAVGGARKEVVKTDSGYEEVLVMSATLSCDHRVVDGAVGAQWLQSFKRYLEDPMKMLL